MLSGARGAFRLATLIPAMSARAVFRPRDGEGLCREGGRRMRSNHSLIPLSALVLLAIVAAPAHADKCTGKKLKAIGKKEGGLLGCHSKVASKGDPSSLAACVSKVEVKYAAAFAKAGSCSGDQAVCECLAENCEAAVRADLPDAGPSICEAARLKAAGKKARGKLTCNAKAATTGTAVDPICIQKAEAKYQAAFAKTTGCSGDQNAVETTIDQECVTAIGADGTGGATVGTICGSCTSMTTTTTLGGATTTTTLATPRFVVFVTHGRFDGNLGGLAGADQKCAQEAQAAGLPGTFKAWLSDATTSAASRLTHATIPYRLVDGTKVADDWTDLTDASLDAAITLTPTCGNDGGGGAWTNTDPSGAISNPFLSCTNWTSAGDSGGDGYVGATDGDWTANSAFPFDTCSVTSRLYCFGQEEATPTTCVPTTTTTTTLPPVCGGPVSGGQCNGSCPAGEACVVEIDTNMCVCISTSLCTGGTCIQFGCPSCVLPGCQADCTCPGGGLCGVY